MNRKKGSAAIRNGAAKEPARRRRTIGSALAVASVIWLGSAAAMPQQDDAPPPTGEQIDSTRAALERWVETRRVISQERRDWEVARDMLNERIELVRDEIQEVRDQIARAESEITEADTRRAEMVDEHDALKGAVTILEESVASLEVRTRTLLNRVPAPLRERVRQLSQELPDESGESKLSLPRRYQNIIGILNEIDKFNREILVTSEVRDLPDGTSAEVTTMYLGIGQAYYVGPNGKIAGIGAAGPDGWEWLPANHAAAEIARAIAIYNNEVPAAFVTLPVEIK